MPSVQKFKSKNVLRNSCELASPIKQLSIDITPNEVYAQERFAHVPQ